MLKSKVISFLLLLFFSNSIIAQYYDRGRYRNGGNSFGLPELNFTGQTLLIGLLLIIIGWLITKFNERVYHKDGSLLGGCLFLLGFIFTLPTFTWIISIFGSIYTIIGLVIIIFGILFLISNIFEK